MANRTETETAAVSTMPASARGQWSWALFDWANQPFFTLITTFVFAPYFVSQVVGDAVQGQALWGYGQAAAGAIIAVSSPLLGAIADASGRRKPWIMVFQVACIIACAALWYATPNASGWALGLVLGAVVIATIGAEFSIVFNNAMLPTLTAPEKLGRLSGYAWALGYVGGLVALALILGGFSLVEVPLFGLDKSVHEHDRVVGPFTAIWMAIFILPMFLFTPDTPKSGIPRSEAARKGLEQLWWTLRSLRHYRNLSLFLLGRLLYFDGLSAAFAFGGIYAAGIFDWTTTNLGIFGIILSFFAAVGAAIGGRVDDVIGSKRTIAIALAGVFLATIGIISITVDGLGSPERRDTILFFIQFSETPNSGMFTALSEQIFLLFGILMGLFAGPVLTASRTMIARLSPPEMIGEFYGLYALSGKATAFVAPLAIALLTETFMSQRMGLAIIPVFLLAGFIVLLPVREERADAVHR